MGWDRDGSRSRTLERQMQRSKNRKSPRPRKEKAHHRGQKVQNCPVSGRFCEVARACREQSTHCLLKD